MLPFCAVGTVSEATPPFMLTSILSGLGPMFGPMLERKRRPSFGDATSARGAFPFITYCEYFWVVPPTMGVPGFGCVLVSTFPVATSSSSTSPVCSDPTASPAVVIAMARGFIATGVRHFSLKPFFNSSALTVSRACSLTKTSSPSTSTEAENFGAGARVTRGGEAARSMSTSSEEKRWVTMTDVAPTGAIAEGPSPTAIDVTFFVASSST